MSKQAARISDTRSVEPGASMSTTATHTPGPWRIDALSATSGLHIQGHNGNTVIVEEDYFHFPDEMGSAQREQIGEELVANAHVIAAAPDMLEALEKIFECGSIKQAELIAQAAIAKAKGGAA